MKFKIASNGKKFGVFWSNGGNYITAVDDWWFHRAPASYERLEPWTDEEADAALAAAIDYYELHEIDDTPSLGVKK